MVELVEAGESGASAFGLHECIAELHVFFHSTVYMEVILIRLGGLQIPLLKASTDLMGFKICGTIHLFKTIGYSGSLVT